MTPPNAEPLLHVHALRVTLQTTGGPAEALRDVGFTLPRGGTLGLIGESGCGKSLTALAVMGLLPEHAVVAGSIRLRGRELVGLHDDALCTVRGRHIGMVFQEPTTALNPLHTIGRQVAEPLRLHKGLSASAARAEACRLLDRVHLPQARERLDAYPHHLSGGQRQRVVIAAALACGPQLLIADEPTTALDVTTQREVLDLIQSLVRDDGMALLLISHDLAVMADRVQQVLVMYGGTVVDCGPTADVFSRRAHPYTHGLFAARPHLRGGQRAARAEDVANAAGGADAAPAPRARLATIRGRVPALGDMPAGCPFADRCDLAVDACRSALPPLLPAGPRHNTRCIRIGATAQPHVTGTATP